MNAMGLIGFYVLTIILWSLADALNWKAWVTPNSKSRNRFGIWHHVVRVLSYLATYLWGKADDYSWKFAIWILITYTLYRFCFFDGFYILFTGQSKPGSTDPLDKFWRWSKINPNSGLFITIKIFLAFLVGILMFNVL